MLFSRSALAALALAAGALAQRPDNTSICDYYTTALLKENTAANQYTLLTLIVNTVVIGNYTTPNVGIKVPGILARGSFNGTDVDLLPYFDGSLASSNRGGNSGASVNFLDDGGAAPLMKNKPSNGTNSRQYQLLTHLYEFFGALLGCSQYATNAFPAYDGHASMASVHKFMKLDQNEVGYFIQQVGLSALSFGAAESDVQVVGAALAELFGYRCSPKTTVIPAQGPQYQAICQADTCPLAANATCDAYPTVAAPSAASTDSNVSATSSDLSSPTVSSTDVETETTATASASAGAPVNTGAANKLGMGPSVAGAIMMMAFPWLI